MQFFVEAGSGKKRGWCMRCAAATCGQHKCDQCIHWKKKMELIESGRAGMDLITTGVCDSLPASVSVPCDVPVSSGGVILGKD